MKKGREMGENNSNKITFLEWLSRAISWLDVGSRAQLTGFDLFFWTVFGPFGEKAQGFRLEEEMERIAKEVQEDRQQMLIGREIDRSAIAEPEICSIVKNQGFSFSGHNRKANSAKELEVSNGENKWLEIMVRPCVVLILGKRGSGKSALGYRLLELFRYKRSPYVLGIPEQAARLLPDCIGIVQNLAEIPPHSIVLIDEAHLPFSSRESFKAYNKQVSKFISLTRQKDLILIFVTQEARQADRNIASSADVFVFKQLGVLQLKFDRPELGKIAARAKQELDVIGSGKVRWSYVLSQDADFEGLVSNSLATFWNEALSCAFAMTSLSTTGRTAKYPAREEQAAKAKEIYLNVRSYRKGAEILGVSVGKFYNLVNEYPYRKKPDE
jgi:hypothetical protein